MRRIVILLTRRKLNKILIIYNNDRHTHTHTHTLVFKTQFAIDREERTCIVQVSQRID